MIRANRALLLIAVCILGFLSGAGDAAASAFTVTPVRVILGRGTNSALLTVRNDSTDSLRFEISLQAWNQSLDGEMQLSETKDVVFFPHLMELKPGEEKNVRIGSAFKTPVLTERSYRIFFEELPPAQVTATTTEQSSAGAQVRVLTRMGVPIFIQPASLQMKADLANLTVNGRQVQVEVRNIGNTYFTVTGATITGLSDKGSPTFKNEQGGWYVLAGGIRRFLFQIPEEACPSTERIRVEVASSLMDEKGKPSTLLQELAVPKGTCGTARAQK